MKTIFLSFAPLLLTVFSFGQQNEMEKPLIMTLGVFHFNYPNQDNVKTAKKDQMDVLDDIHQKEIMEIINALKTFRPTKILVEVQPVRQAFLDSVYSAYRKGSYQLKKSEVHQIGFQIAREMDLPFLHCVDEWGKYYHNLEFLNNDSSSRTLAFMDFYKNNPDSFYRSSGSSRDANSNIIDLLINGNDPGNINERLGMYLTGVFKYEEKEGDFLGVDFETSRWFNRNFRIFRNIQRIPVVSTDRLLLIIGAEHLNILNYLIVCSPEYDLVSPLPYLQEAKKALVE